jgi:hypothetical protein
MNGIYLIINHHFDFTEDELIGIRSQLRALKYMDVCLVTYSQNQLDKFIDIFKEDISELAVDQNKIIVEYFDHKYFESIQGYNNLLCSTEFYGRFNQYDFIIVSQPDVYLLDEDKISDLSSIMKNYDYIGAPWVFKIFDNKSLRKLKFYFPISFLLSKVDFYLWYFTKKVLPKKLFDFIYLSGNGGFSVRNPIAMINYLESMTVKDQYRIKDLRENANNENEFGIYAEDVFWSIFPKVLNKKLKIAPSHLSIKYAWEQGTPNRLLYYSDNTLPLGIHAWMKLDLKEFVLKYQKEFSEKIKSN